MNLINHIGNEVTVWTTEGNSLENRKLITADEMGIVVSADGSNTIVSSDPKHYVFIPWNRVKYVDLIRSYSVQGTIEETVWSGSDNVPVASVKYATGFDHLRGVKVYGSVALVDAEPEQLLEKWTLCLTSGLHENTNDVRKWIENILYDAFQKSNIRWHGSLQSQQKDDQYKFHTTLYFPKNYSEMYIKSLVYCAIEHEVGRHDYSYGIKYEVEPKVCSKNDDDNCDPFVPPSTLELVDSLAKREGMTELIVNPHEHYALTLTDRCEPSLIDKGPARILIIKDKGDC